MRSAALVFAILSGLLAAYLIGSAAFDPAIALHPSTTRAAPMLRILLTGLGELIALAGALALSRARLAGVLLLLAALLWAALTWLLQHVAAPILYGPAVLSLLGALFALTARAPKHVLVQTVATVPDLGLAAEPVVITAPPPSNEFEASAQPKVVDATVVSQPSAAVLPVRSDSDAVATAAPPEGPAFSESGAEAWVDDDHARAGADEPSAFASFALAFSNIATFLLYGLVAAAVFALLLAPPTRSMLRRSLPPGATSAPTPVIEPTSSLPPPATSPSGSSQLPDGSDDLSFSLPDLPSRAAAASEPPL